MEILDKMLEALEKAGFTVNPAKCIFRSFEVNDRFQGGEISLFLLTEQMYRFHHEYLIRCKRSERWLLSCEKQAFKNLKQHLLTDPVLVLCSPKAVTKLHTDSSDNGLSGLLMQEG